MWPLTFIGYFLFNKFGKNMLAKIYIVGMSLWFYGYFNPSYLLLIAISILVNYFLCDFMRKTEKKP